MEQRNGAMAKSTVVQWTMVQSNGTVHWCNGRKYTQWQKVHAMAESALIETLQRESECVTRIRSAAAFQG